MKKLILLIVLLIQFLIINAEFVEANSNHTIYWQVTNGTSAVLNFDRIVIHNSSPDWIILDDEISANTNLTPAEIDIAYMSLVQKVY
jgi:hypothetical protein